MTPPDPVPGRAGTRFAGYDVDCQLGNMAGVDAINCICSYFERWLGLARCRVQ